MRATHIAVATSYLAFLSACTDAPSPTEQSSIPSRQDATALTAATRGTSAFANEPAGMTPLTLHTGDGKPSGWWEYDPYNRVSYIDDRTAPHSPLKVMNFQFRKDTRGGTGPGGFTGYGSTSTPMKVNSKAVNEVFFGFFWKVNPGWQQPTGAQAKILYTYSYRWTDATRNCMIPLLIGTGSAPWGIAVQSEVAGKVANYYANRTSTPIYDGRWYKMEFYFKKSSAPGVADGVIRWWINGTLAGEFTGVVRSANPFSEFHMNPVWGGSSRLNKQQEDYMRFDQLYLSAR